MLGWEEEALKFDPEIVQLPSEIKPTVLPQAEKFKDRYLFFTYARYLDWVSVDPNILSPPS